MSGLPAMILRIRRTIRYETRNQPQRFAARICFRAVENGWDAEGDDFQNLRHHPIDQGAATPIKEFYTLPAGGHLWQYDRLAVNTVVKTVNGTVRLCDIPFSEDIHQFNEDYLRLTRQVHDTNEDHLLGDEYMAVDTSTLAECEIDGVASVYSELFTNPFLAWGKYRRGLFKTTLPISFQFHHAQMDGFEAARFLNGLQETINGLKIG